MPRWLFYRFRKYECATGEICFPACVFHEFKDGTIHRYDRLFWRIYMRT